MKRVEIAGVGIHPFGRFAGKTVTQMGAEAVRDALAEADDASFQAAFCGTAYSGVASPSTLPGRCERSTAARSSTRGASLARSTTAAAPSFGEHSIKRRSGSHTTGEARIASSESALRYIAWGFATPWR